VNRFLRDNGFGVALVIGVALLAVGLVAANPAALVIAIILLVIGVSARPLEQFALNRSGFLLKWQREVAEKLQRRVEDRLTFSDSVDFKVIRGEGRAAQRRQTASGQGQSQVITPGTLQVESRTFPPAVTISEPLPSDEFVETLMDQIIEPAFVASGERVNAPTVEQGQPPADTKPGNRP
jgi:hypothetical protein